MAAKTPKKPQVRHAAQKKNAGRRKNIVDNENLKPPRTGIRKWVYRFFVGMIWILILLVPVTIYYAHDLPDISEITQPKGGSTVMVMDRGGGLLASYGDVYGDWLEFDDIPTVLVQAVIATEDRRFFDHGGFDIRGFTRAMIKNITRRSMVEGGSTISQQLAKNLF